jgi:hypothetical protein
MTRFTPPCDELEAFYTIALRVDLDTPAGFGSGATLDSSVPFSWGRGMFGRPVAPPRSPSPLGFIFFLSLKRGT